MKIKSHAMLKKSAKEKQISIAAANQYGLAETKDANQMEGGHYNSVSENKYGPHRPRIV